MPAPTYTSHTLGKVCNGIIILDVVMQLIQSVDLIETFMRLPSVMDQLVCRFIFIWLFVVVVVGASYPFWVPTTSSLFYIGFFVGNFGHVQFSNNDSNKEMLQISVFAKVNHHKIQIMFVWRRSSRFPFKTNAWQSLRTVQTWVTWYFAGFSTFENVYQVHHTSSSV